MSRASLRARAGDRRGVAALEFAVVAPVLVLLLAGTADILTALRTQLRLETAAVQVGQVVSQCLRITDNPGNTTDDLGQFWAHGQRIMGNLGNVSTQGAIIITAVRNRAGPQNGGRGTNEVAWQRRTGAGDHGSTVANRGTAAARTEAQPGDAATIAEGFLVPADDTLFVTEVSLNRTALLLRGSVVGTALPQQLRAATLFLSRAPVPRDMQTPPAAPTVNDPGGLSCTA